MSTYVLSDIHGHKDELDMMLDKIAFSNDDVMYILGDIADKGEQSGEMFRWAVDDAPDNIHFLLGNHEDMAGSTLHHTMGDPRVPYNVLWRRNKGGDTIAQLIDTFDGDKQTTKNWINENLLPWIDGLPLYAHLEMGDSQFMLVHGGFNPEMFDSARENGWLGMFDCGANYDMGARWENVKIGHGFGTQRAQEMLWAREDWHLSEIEPPMTVVFGHSYIKEQRVNRYNSYGAKVTGGAGKIAHIGERKIAIDCGCAYARRDPDGTRRGIYNLGCIRLDNMEEFYVPVIERPL